MFVATGQNSIVFYDSIAKIGLLFFSFDAETTFIKFV